MHLDKINVEQGAFLNRPNLGRLRIRSSSEDNLMLMPFPVPYGQKSKLLEPGRYRVLAFKEDGTMCQSTAYLEIE